MLNFSYGEELPSPETSYVVVIGLIVVVLVAIAKVLVPRVGTIVLRGRPVVGRSITTNNSRFDGGLLVNKAEPPFKPGAGFQSRCLRSLLL